MSEQRRPSSPARFHNYAPPVLASHVIAPLIAEFRRRHLKIVIDVDVDSVNEPPIEDFDITLIGTDDLHADVVARKVIDSHAILVASPDYLARRGTLQTPQALADHECLRVKAPHSRRRMWRMWCPEEVQEPIEVAIHPVLVTNHADTLLRAVLDGAGITSVSIDLVTQSLTRGDLVRVLSPWITGTLAIYAALPSRKFIPHRTRVFVDYLVEETRLQAAKALQACSD